MTSTVCRKLIVNVIVRCCSCGCCLLLIATSVAAALAEAHSSVAETTVGRQGAVQHGSVLGVFVGADRRLLERRGAILPTYARRVNNHRLQY